MSLQRKCLFWLFLYVLTANNQKDGKANIPLPQRNSAGKQEIKQPAPLATIGSSPIVLPLNVAGNAVNTAAPNLTTVTPQPVIVNNQVQIACKKNNFSL